MFMGQSTIETKIILLIIIKRYALPCLQAWIRALYTVYKITAKLAL